MFRLNRIRLQNFKIATQLGKIVGGNIPAVEGAEMGTKGKKGPKKDKPNPNQPSTKKKPDKPAIDSTFVPDDTPLGEKKDTTKPMQ